MKQKHVNLKLEDDELFEELKGAISSGNVEGACLNGRKLIGVPELTEQGKKLLVNN